MKLRNALFVVLAAGYGLCLIGLTTGVRARAQARPQRAPAVPRVPPVAPSPVLAQVPELPTLAPLNLPAIPVMLATPAVPAAPAAPAAPAWESDSWSGWTHWDSPASDCSDLHIRLHDERPTIDSEERSVTKAEAPVLRVREVRNGGVQVQGWDKETYSVTACKAAAGPDAARLLSQMKLSVQGGEVAVSVPTSELGDWTVSLLIRTPRSADVEVSTHNGPVSFYSVDGKITTRATNGPISLKDCSGEADISAENGPITFSGTSGKLHLQTRNGPITVSLGANWNGSELVAAAVNGPLTLRVPSGFHSSFLVESNGHSPVSCHASICSEARKTWDDEHRRIEYGSGAPIIRLSTENGPISVAD
jgi:hypothetical protein